MATENVHLGMREEELDTPALCVDLDLMERNIQLMEDSLRPLGVRVRPHAKTHKCPIMACKQLKAGAIGVCCAKLGEAEAMAEGGVTGILITSQIVGSTKIARLVSLASWADVTVAVDDSQNAADLNAAAGHRGIQLKVIIEMDVGMDRCGVRTIEEGVALAEQIVASRNLRFEGIMGYEGHCVMMEPYSERERVARSSLARLIQLKSAIEAVGIPVAIVSSGGTGTYQITPRIAGITEIQAGSYITMDAKYRSTGTKEFAMALTLLTTVISVPRPDLAYCDMGLKAVTIEFGLPVVANPVGWELTRLHEEHGRLERTDGTALRVGDRIRLYPSHGCTTINLHDYYFAVRRGILEAVWPISARGKYR